VNKKVVKYCCGTLEKMVNYHNLNDEELLGVILDLKRLLMVNQINLYKISKYESETDKKFFVKLKDLLFDKYVKNAIIKEWLELFMTNEHINFDEILAAADYYNSKTLEINVKINKKVELNSTRRRQIFNFVLVKVKNEEFNFDDYNYFIVNIADKKNKEKNNLCIFKREYIEEMAEKQEDALDISKTEMMNTIFDYFIINKQMKKNEYN